MAAAAAAAAEEASTGSAACEPVASVWCRASGTRRRGRRKRRCVHLQCYCISVATILGTGILGLPVTIAHAGLIPFLISFVIGFFVQALLIYLFVDLLQRCQAVQVESLKSLETERILMQDVGEEEPSIMNTEDEEEHEEVDYGLLQRDASAKGRMEGREPNLHFLGVLFLNKYMSHAFNFILLFQFISIGISYVLAGSEAFAVLFHVSHVYVIPVFTWTLSLGIIVAQVVIQPITSLLTLLKGILLIITVVVTFVVGSEVHREIVNDFSHIGKPFLMGTVALGGIVNVMPFLFSEISYSKIQILWFRRAILGGLFTCTVLNILWCWAVLEIVPQMSVQKVLEDGISNNSSVLAEASPPAYTFIYSNVSLEEAEEAGEIATIPLTKIIIQKYSRFSWVAELVQTFIAVSVSVSFLVMGSAMKHTIDGLVNLQRRPRRCERTLSRCLPSLSNGFMCFLAFGLIFIVASFDPKGFVTILDKVVSFSLNTEVGLFIFLMLRRSRSEPYKDLSVPLPMGERLFSLYWLLPLYFLFAVGYDVVESLLDVADSWTHNPTSLPNSSLH